jgi:hypothetical protein
LIDQDSVLTRVSKLDLDAPLYLAVDELAYDLGRALDTSLCPAVLDRHVAALDPTEFAQPLHKGGGPVSPGRGRADAEEPDSRQVPRLLRARRERPRGCTAEQRDELAPPHSITSSAGHAAAAPSSVMSPRPFMLISPG